MANQQTNIPAVPISTPMHDEQGRLTRTWIIFFEKIAQFKSVRDFFNADTRFWFNLGIGAPQPVGSITIAPCPVVFTPGAMVKIEANSNLPGTGSIYLDILRSADNGVTWKSILPAGSENKIVLTAGEAIPRCLVETFAPDPDSSFEVRNLIAIEVLAGSATDWQNIYVSGKWA